MSEQDGQATVVETIETVSTVTSPVRAAAAERVDGIPAVPAVPEGIRRAAGIDDTTPAELAETEPSVAAGDAAELARLRELVLAANQDVVPELVAGSNLDELLASVEGAKAAYARTEERVRATAQVDSSPAAPSVPVVPAGGGKHVADVDSLSPRTKIARALGQREQRRG